VSVRDGVPEGALPSVAIVKPPAPLPPTVSGPVVADTVPSASVPSSDCESVLPVGGAGKVGCGDTAVETVAEVLFATSGSFVELVTDAEFDNAPAATTQTLNVDVALAASVATVQVNVELVIEQPADDVRKSRPLAGSTSVTTTEFASSGPALLTTIV
jgi:hypothetical protein